MTKWSKIKLGDVITIKGGFSYKGSYIGSGSSLLLGMGCVSNNQRFLKTGARLYSGECSSTHLASPGEIVIATRQQSDNMPILGFPAIIPKDFSGKTIIVGTNLYKVVNTSNVKNNFLYWLLKSPSYQAHILACSKGTTVRMITKDAIESFEFFCPPSSEQDAICELLDALDSKIELLRRNSRTLETMAESLYKQQFVNCNNKDWKIKQLGDYVHLVSGYSYRSADLQPSTDALVTLKNFDRNGGFKQDGFKEYIGRYKEEQLVVNGDLIVAHTDLTQEAEVLGNPAIVISTTKYRKLIISTDLVKLIPTSYLSKSYLYFLLKSDDFKHYCIGASNGTTVLHLSKTALPKYEFCLPPESLVKDFTSIVEPMLNKLTQNEIQIANLEKLRDSLLPKLMTGALTIKTLEDELVCS